MIKRLLFWIYTTALLLITLLPINSEGAGLNNNYFLSIRWDYLLHAMMYIPLPILAGLIWKKGSKSPVTSIFLITNFCLIFALATEYTHYYLPYRSFNFNDMMANGIGVVIGVGISWIITKTYNLVSQLNNKPCFQLDSIYSRNSMTKIFM